MSYHFTKEGLELTQKQIRAQEDKVRAIGREAGEEAGMNCDWHDNFGYEDAKRRLEMESTTLQNMKEEISGAQVIAIQEQSDKVAIGVTVDLFMGDERKEFTIGAYGESDPGNGLISYTTPLAKGLLRMEVGDTKSLSIGGKTVDIEIEGIHPPSYRYHNLIANLIRAGNQRA